MASLHLERPLGSHGSGLVPGSSFGPIRTLVLGLSKLIFASLSAASVSAAPLSTSGSGRHGLTAREHLDGDDPDSRADIWVLYVASIVLVLLGGAFAGLTIALMGQDSIYLQVLSRDETDPQQKNARRVYELLQRGKHWVLVTLLLSNVIVNETLPVVLDRCLGGGVAAVVGSTLLIVVFGEVLPQSVCVRYGLQIGGFMAKPVLALMWLMAPVAWPTAKVLDHALGEDHGTVYKKSGLKTLVTLHRSLGEVSERLTQDEVTIISAVLDLKEKPVSSVMTPMDDVFTMSEDTVLDEEMMDMILSAGYSRIPIHERDNPTNFVGMLLVKILITYDPDDKRRVSEFPLATLPETRPETSCLDIVNFFQEGKSHMVIVSQYPGEDYGALGVVTLEDVIEELIGEEIIDESDVYIDVHKAIRRLQPAPRARLVRSQFPRTEQEAASAIVDETVQPKAGSQNGQQQPHQAVSTAGDVDSQVLSSSPKLTTVMMHRRSAGADGRVAQSTVPVRANIDEMWQHLRHLGPSNPATNPKNTRSTTVKIKPAIASAIPRDTSALQGAGIRTGGDESHHIAEEADEDVEADETTFLLGPNAVVSHDRTGSSPKRDYGSAEPVAAAARSALSALSDTSTAVAGHGRNEGATIVESVIETVQHSSSVKSGKQTLIPGLSTDGSNGDNGLSGNVADALATAPAAAAPVCTASNGSDSGSSRNDGLLNVIDHTTITTRHGIVRSGSITENVVETRGIRKVVLETNSSADEEDDLASANLRRHHVPSGLQPHAPEQTDSDKEPVASASTDAPSEAAPEAAAASGGAGKKKTRRKKRKGGSGK